MRKPPPRFIAFVACSVVAMGGFLILSQTSRSRLEPRTSPGERVAKVRERTGDPLKQPSGSSTSPALISAVSMAVAGKRPQLPPRYGAGAKAEEFNRALEITVPAVASRATWHAGDRVSLAYFDNRVLTGVVLGVDRDADGQALIVGALDEGGSFTLGIGPRGVGGRIMPVGASVAVVVSTKATTTYLLEKPRQSVMCVNYVHRPGASGSGGAATVSAETTVTIPQPAFSSRPGVTAVVYLDFDGETVEELDWRIQDDDNNPSTPPVLLPPIEAGHSLLNDAQIKEVWQRVSEDFRPFKINVTTDRALYDAAPAGTRMRCIVTTTTTVAPNSGGVAYTGSWADATAPGYSNNVPCWVFSSQLLYDAKSVAEAVSHEIGHTLGLSHDGLRNAAGATVEEYYFGHGSGATGWAPIMGVGYYQALTQWSRGEYVSGEDVANNLEDDLAIIGSSANRTGYVADTAAGVLDDAKTLPLINAGEAEVVGEIGRTGDEDTYQVLVGAGTVSFAVGPAPADVGIAGLGNLDAKLELYDASGVVRGISNPLGQITAALTATVPAGVYRLRIRGMGEGSVADGYSDYASLGRYRLSGTFPIPDAQAPVIGGNAEWVAVAGAAASYRVEAVGSPLAYYASGLPDALKMDRTTGAISGTPTAPGNFPFTVTAFNASGSTTRVLNLVVLPAGLGDAISAPALTWTTGGDLPWSLDTEVFFDRRSAFRSGPIHGDQQSWVETTVVGPGELAFRWKVSSELNPHPQEEPYDRLEFIVDGVREAFISGEQDWVAHTYSVPAGSHTLRWVYQKDPYSSVGEDTGWLDAVVYAQALAPVVSSPAPAVVTAGNGYGFQMVATNAPVSFAAEGLPPGLAINSATGMIGGVPTTAGDYQVTLAATNAHGTGNATLSLKVMSRFASWASAHGLSNAQAATNADPDGDGFANLLEYALGLDPTTANPAGGRAVTLQASGGVSRLQLEFVRPPDCGELTYAIEVSTDLGSAWQAGHAYGPLADNSGTLPTVEVARIPLGDGRERIQVRENLAADAPRRFMRLKITSP